MATIRRLSDTDVRAIFESLHNNTSPPPNLDFKIVPVGSDGLKLSPPSIKFNDGLYILLKPQKRKKSMQDSSQPKVPSNFVDKLLTEIPNQECPWSLSGPQFPQPTAIQQRYCYPRGDPDYSSQKGGALWTMYGTDGKENLEYRLLHVYFSAKRAVNKGSRNSAVPSPRPAKRPKSSPKPKHRRLPSVSRQAVKNIFDHDATKAPASPLLMAPYIDHPEESIEGLSPNLSFDMEPLDLNFVTPENNDFTRLCSAPELPPLLPAKEGAAISLQEPTLQELESCWVDPFVPLEDDPVRLFAAKLEHISYSIQDLIHSTSDQQGHLCSILTEWAKQLATSPLSEINLEAAV